MADPRPETTDDTGLQEFEVVVEWIIKQRTKRYAIVARSKEDAKRIARLLFLKGHDDSCVIEEVDIANG